MPTEPLILCIETATTMCSVAIGRGGDTIASKELDAGYTHAENLHLFIDTMLKETGVAPPELACVALSAGPGSYTGLRIGSSSAKGICFALNIPLVTIGTLQIMAAASRRASPQSRHFLPMIDAGRMEVYTALFDDALHPVGETRAVILNEQSVAGWASVQGLAISGTGMEKVAGLLGSLAGATLLQNIRPSAKEMPALAVPLFRQQQFTEIADFEPLYLKNFIAGKKKGTPSS